MKKILLGLMVAVAVGATCTAKVDTVEYRKTVEAGDTVWGICNTIATKNENLNRMVIETVMRNKIKDCENLQVGQEIVVVVERQNFFGMKVK